jgi:hypothetical protein
MYGVPLPVSPQSPGSESFDVDAAIAEDYEMQEEAHNNGIRYEEEEEYECAPELEAGMSLGGATSSGDDFTQPWAHRFLALLPVVRRVRVSAAASAMNPMTMLLMETKHLVGYPRFHQSAQTRHLFWSHRCSRISRRVVL